QVKVGKGGEWEGIFLWRNTHRPKMVDNVYSSTWGRGMSAGAFKHRCTKTINAHGTHTHIHKHRRTCLQCNVSLLINGNINFHQCSMCANMFILLLVIASDSLFSSLHHLLSTLSFSLSYFLCLRYYCFRQKMRHMRLICLSCFLLLL